MVSTAFCYKTVYGKSEIFQIGTVLITVQHFTYLMTSSATDSVAHGENAITTKQTMTLT